MGGHDQTSHRKGFSSFLSFLDFFFLKRYCYHTSKISNCQHFPWLFMGCVHTANYVANTQTTSEKHDWPCISTKCGLTLGQQSAGLLAQRKGKRHPCNHGVFFSPSTSACSAGTADPRSVDLFWTDTTQECWRRAIAQHTKKIICFLDCFDFRGHRKKKKTEPKSGTHPRGYEASCTTTSCANL